MQVLHERFENDSDVSVLAVHFDGRGDPTAYMKEHGYTYRSIPNGGEVVSRFGVTTIPTFMVVDRDGRVVHTFTGELTDPARDEIEAAALRARGG